jgi:glutathione S-transferase
MNKRLDGKEYVVGNSLTIADLTTASSLMYAKQTDAPGRRPTRSRGAGQRHHDPREQRRGTDSFVQRGGARVPGKIDRRCDVRALQIWPCQLWA